MISACLVSLNEAEKLTKCLDSLKDFSDEIIVVDLGSDDKTLDICQKYKVKVYKHKYESFVEKVRNFAISKARGDWIMILDPDELISEKLKQELYKISKSEKFNAVNIPRKNIFFGKWIMHTNWWPDRHIRFFKKGKVIWSEKIHSYPEVEGKILELPADGDLAIAHFGYDNLSQFLNRQNKYSNIEAEQRFNEGERFSWSNFIWKPIREFLTRFIKHLGFLDGFYGLSLTFFMCVYQMILEVKLWELEKQK